MKNVVKHHVVFLFLLFSGLLRQHLYAAVAVGDYQAVPLYTVAGKDARLERQWLALVLPFNQKSLIDYYKQHGTRDEAWDKDALKLLANWTDRFTFRKSNTGNNKLYWLAKKLEKTECADPLVYYCIGKCYGIYYRDKDNLAAYAKAYALMQSHDCPVIRKMFTCLRMAEIYAWIENRSDEQQQQFEGFINEYLSYLGEAMETGVYTGMERLLIDHLSFTLDDHAGEKLLLDGLLKMSEKAELPWLAECMAGKTLVHMAWWYRGNAVANTMTKEDWAEMRRCLADAELRLTHAWELNPQSPLAATEMITLAMGSQTTLPARAWFDRAVAAEFDYSDAYDTYVASIMPRWHGSYPQMIAFGLECAATKRYDTYVPLRLIKMIDYIWDDSLQFARPEITEALFKDKQLWQAVAQVLNEAMAAGYFGHSKSWYHTTYISMAYKFGELQIASDALDAMEEKLDQPVLKYYHLDKVNLHIETLDPLDDL